MESAVLCRHCSRWWRYDRGYIDFRPAELGSNAEEDIAYWNKYGERLGLPAPLSSGGSLTGASGEKEIDSNERYQSAFYDATASVYDLELLDDSTFWEAEESLVMGAWMTTFNRADNAIDLGTGTGRCLAHIASQHESTGAIVGVDISAEMLEIAARRVQGSRIPVILVAGSCKDLAFVRPNAFSFGTAYGLIHHVDEPERVISEWARISTERSRLWIHDNNTSAFRRLFDLLMAHRPLWSDDGHEWHPVTKPDDLCAWAYANGFEISWSTSVFVPPHLCELAGVRGARQLISLSDQVCGRIPWLRRQGGILLAELRRTSAI